MKKITALFALAIVMLGKTQAQGIAFEAKKTWQQMLQQAASEKKLIFVDVYTTWCGPCKKMDTEIFSTKAVGDLYNQTFLNYKLDAEKGEGVTLNQRYQVDAYPTFLFVNAQGELVYKHIGLATVPGMKQLAQLALLEQHEPKKIALWDQEYSQKKNDTLFLYEYLVKRTKLQLPSHHVFEAYLAQLTPAQKNSSKVMTLLTMYERPVPVGSSVFALLVTSLNSWKTKENHPLCQKVNAALETSMRVHFHQVMKENSEEKFRAFLETNRQMPASYLHHKPEAELEEVFYRINKNFAQYSARVIPYVEKILLPQLQRGVDAAKANDYAHTLNNAAEFVAMQTDNQETLRQAKAWMEEALKVKSTIYPTNFLVHHTYGQVLCRLGEKERALVQYQTALQAVPKEDRFYQQIQTSYLQLKNDLGK